MLLLAAAPAGAETRAYGGVLAGVVKGSTKALTLRDRDRASGERHGVDVVTAYLEVDDEKEAHAAPAMRVRSSAVRQPEAPSARPFYRVANRTHPSCAAPPTGPPHA